MQCDEALLDPEPSRFASGRIALSGLRLLLADVWLQPDGQRVARCCRLLRTTDVVHDLNHEQQLSLCIFHFLRLARLSSPLSLGSPSRSAVSLTDPLRSGFLDSQISMLLARSRGSELLVRPGRLAMRDDS